MTDLNGKSVLVTGAGGFIGSRLSEMLVEARANVHVLLRSGVDFDAYQKLGCRPFRGDITLTDSLPPAVEGCQYVFHCAVGGGDLTESRRINVEGTLNLLRAAKEAGVQRAVHVSSISVHGSILPPDAPEIVREDQPFVTTGGEYDVSKAEGEQAALKFGRENNLEVVAIRPTLVYGPKSTTWTTTPLERIKYEQMALVGGGIGIANLVYIDDLVYAMMLAATVQGAAGEAYFISGPETPTWREVIDKYARLLKKPSPPSLPLWKAKLVYPIEKFHYRLTRKPERIAPFDRLAHVQTNIYSIEKAKRDLGYSPQFTLERGLREIEAWIKATNFHVYA